MDVEDKVLYTLAPKKGGGKGQDSGIVCLQKLLHIQ